MHDTASLVAGNLIYDGLLKFSPTLEIKEALAESWSTSSDGKTLIFKLRSDAKFHDESQISASDVVYSLARAVSPESTVRKYYDCIEGTDEKNGTKDYSKIGIKALDARTIEIRLKRPFPAFISVLAGATAKILPKKFLNDKNYFNSPIGSGAFKFSLKDLANKKITLDAFEHYYAGKTKIDHMVLLETTEEVATSLARKNEVLDLASWPLTKNNDVFNGGKRITSPVAATWIIGLNTKSVPFNSLETRRSFKESFDTDGFRKKFYPDAYPAFGYIPPGLPGYKESESRHYKINVNKKQKITIVIPEELSDAKEMKEYFENDLSRKGWNVKVLPMPWEKLMDGYAKKKYQAFLVSMNMDYPDSEFLLRNFESYNSDNFSGISNKKLDSLIDASRAEIDKKRRTDLYKEAIQLLDDSALTVNLFHPRANYWVSNCVQGLEPNILSDVYIDYSKVTINDECIRKGGKL